MPEPTIQDVLNKLDSFDTKIDYIKNKVDVIKDTVSDLVIPKIDETDDKVETIQTIVETKDNLYQTCSTCAGAGKLIYKDDAQPGVLLEKVCPLCNGNKIIVFGTIKV